MTTTVRTPVLRITGPSGGNLVASLGDAFLGVTITDQDGYESDECTIRVAAAAPFPAPPARGTPYTVWVGYADGAMAMTGFYAFQRASFIGDPESGEEMHLVCRAADFIDADKTVDSRHYDAETGHGRAGAIFQELATEMGVSAVIAPEIAAIAVPYRLRWRQSAIDFATELGDDIGAAVKPQAGRLVIRARGSGASGSGLGLPTLTIPHDPSYGHEVSLEPREEYQEIETPWFDPALGRMLSEALKTAFTASRLSFPHPFPTQGEAKRGAAAIAQEMARMTGTGSFEMAGTSLAVAGAPATCSGFGPAIDSIPWQIASVEHTIDPGDAGWITTVEVQTQEGVEG